MDIPSRQDLVILMSKRRQKSCQNYMLSWKLDCGHFRTSTWHLISQVYMISLTMTSHCGRKYDSVLTSAQSHKLKSRHHLNVSEMMSTQLSNKYVIWTSHPSLCSRCHSDVRNRCKNDLTWTLYKYGNGGFKVLELHAIYFIYFNY